MVGFHECATKFATLVATAKGSFNLISCGRLKIGIGYSNSLATTAYELETTFANFVVAAIHCMCILSTLYSVVNYNKLYSYQNIKLDCPVQRVQRHTD